MTTARDDDQAQSSSVLQEGDPIKTGNWTHGLFGCMDNVGLCALTFFAPCVTFGRLAKMMGDDCLLFGFMYLIPGLNCYLESKYREKIRMRRGILDSRLMDVLTVVLCPPCALTQEANEVYNIKIEELRLGAIDGGAPPGAFAHTRTGRALAQPGFPTCVPKSQYSQDEEDIIPPGSAPAAMTSQAGFSSQGLDSNENSSNATMEMTRE